MERLNKPGIKSNPLVLKFNETLEPIRYLNGYKYYVEVLGYAKKQYKLRRIKSRLRVSFIGYSYNIKLK